jgi:hypothetical protein
MIEIVTVFPFIFCLNSFLLIGLIFIQNDNLKTSLRKKNSSGNPLENWTWASFFFQISLLLIQIKIIDF